MISASVFHGVATGSAISASLPRETRISSSSRSNPRSSSADSVSGLLVGAGPDRVDLDRVEVPFGVGPELGRRPLAERESVGQQRLVGGGPEVAPDLAGDATAQDRPQQLLDLAGDLRRAGRAFGLGRLPAPELTLE